MPNWCYNEMVVYGNATELKDFQEKLKHASAQGTILGNWQLYELYREFGYEEQEILNSDSNGYIRGNIIGTSRIKLFNNQIPYIKVEYESAWSPMIYGFEYLLKNHYRSLKQVTFAEEPNMDIFVNTDIDQIFFKGRYRLYVEDYDTYYCEDEKDVVEKMNMYIDSEEEKCHSIKDCYTRLKKGGGYVNDYYMTLNEMSID